MASKEEKIIKSFVIEVASPLYIQVHMIFEERFDCFFRFAGTLDHCFALIAKTEKCLCKIQQHSILPG